MAKITVIGQVCVVTSEFTLEAIKRVHKYRPEALRLYDDSKKNCIFEVGISNNPNGCLNEFGAEFGGHTHDEAAKATITMQLGNYEGDVKEYVADRLGKGIANLNAIESKLSTVVGEVDAEHQAMLNGIELR
jgi:hypothetical protein